jgi:hypothetical protein
MFYFLTQFVQQVKGYSPLTAGFAFLPISVVIVTMAQIASRVIVRVGAQSLIITGTIAVGFGLTYLSSLSPSSSYLGHLLPSIVLIAVGMGCIFVPITLTAVGGVAPEDSGIASAMLNVGQQVGGTLGLSALVTVFGSAARHAASHSPGLSGAALARHVFTEGADRAFRAGALFALGGLVVALMLIRTPTGAGAPTAEAASE